MRFEKNVTSYTWQRKRQVLELEAIEKDYSYLVPILYEEGYDIANIIMKQYADGDSGKWLVFMDSKADGQWILKNISVWGIMMMVHLQIEGRYYYAVLSFYNSKGKRIPRWIPTKCAVDKNTKRKASGF